MSKKLEIAFKKILAEPYNPSEDGKDHEKGIRNIIAKELGASVIVKKTKISLEKFVEEKANGLYVINKPYGSQRPPDALICEINNGIIVNNLWVDVKRSETGKAMWNSGFPEQEAIYVYNGTEKGTKKKTGQSGTTILLGKALTSPQEAASVAALKTLLCGFKHNPTINGTTITFTNWDLQHLRVMLKEKGKQGLWLSHPDRQSREKQVLDFAKQFIL